MNMIEDVSIEFFIVKVNIFGILFEGNGCFLGFKERGDMRFIKIILVIIYKIDMRERRGEGRLIRKLL